LILKQHNSKKNKLIQYDILFLIKKTIKFEKKFKVGADPAQKPWDDRAKASWYVMD